MDSKQREDSKGLTCSNILWQRHYQWKHMTIQTILDFAFRLWLKRTLSHSCWILRGAWLSPDHFRHHHHVTLGVRARKPPDAGRAAQEWVGAVPLPESDRLAFDFGSLQCVVSSPLFFQCYSLANLAAHSFSSHFPMCCNGPVTDGLTDTKAPGLHLVANSTHCLMFEPRIRILPGVPFVAFFILCLVVTRPESDRNCPQQGKGCQNQRSNTV